MLWIALSGRDSGMRCSQLIGITAETAALDFDLACSYRLLAFENKREFARLKAFKQMMKEAVGELFGAKPPEADDDGEWPTLSEDDIL